MIVLGIESSCDETSAAVVEDGRVVRSNIVLSQEKLHGRFGGIVPELACREHIKAIVPVVELALKDAGIVLEEVDLISVTKTPGLVGALLVGVSFAKGLALTTGKPIIGVDHIHAHLYAVKLAFPELDYPCLGLAVSGGHTSLYISSSEIEHKLIGATRDDAAGECFDKAAKILGLGFPGGPVIEKLALGRDTSKEQFYRSMVEDSSYDFSFSGLKTAVLYRVKGQNISDPERQISEDEKKDVCAGLQEAICDILVEKTLKACKHFGIWKVAVGGGVACNKRLREKFKSRYINAFFPEPKYCTDNGAMVAGLGYHFYKSGVQDDLYLDAIATKQHRK